MCDAPLGVTLEESKEDRASCLADDVVIDECIEPPCGGRRQ